MGQDVLAGAAMLRSRTLLEILDTHCAPHSIDFMAVDIDQAGQAFSPNPLQKYKVKILTVHGELRPHPRPHFPLSFSTPLAVSAQPSGRGTGSRKVRVQTLTYPQYPLVPEYADHPQYH